MHMRVCMNCYFFTASQRDPEGRTAVHYAAFFGKHRSLKFLVESASDWTPKYVQEFTTYFYTVFYSYSKQLDVVVCDLEYSLLKGMSMVALHCTGHVQARVPEALLSS